MQNAELRWISLPAASEIFINFNEVKYAKVYYWRQKFWFCNQNCKTVSVSLRWEKRVRFVKQLLRSGTSIGANVSESQRGQSKRDFYSKIAIALKEANETYYWIRLLHATDYLSDKEYLSLESDINEIISILVAIHKSKVNAQDKK